jgi:hypothetical protein
VVSQENAAIDIGVGPVATDRASLKGEILDKSSVGESCLGVVFDEKRAAERGRVDVYRGMIRGRVVEKKRVVYDEFGRRSGGIVPMAARVDGAATQAGPIIFEPAIVGVNR